MSLIFWEGFDAHPGNSTPFHDWLDAKGWDTPDSIIGYDSSAVTRYSHGSGYTGNSIIRKPLGADAHSTIIVGFAISAYTTLGIGSGNVAYLYGDVFTTTHLYVNFDAATKELRVYRGDGTLLGTSSGFQLDNSVSRAFRYVEIVATLDDVAGAVEIISDGVTILDLAGIDTKNGGAGATFTGVGFRKASNYNFMIDDIYVANSLGTEWNAPVGSIRAIGIVPNADGDSSQLVGSDGNSTSNWALVDEVPANVTDYVESPTPGEKDLYHMQALPTLPATAAVKNVRMEHYVAKSDAAAINSRPLMKSNGVEVSDDDIALLTTWQYVHTDFGAVNPATGQPWTTADVADLQVGMEVRP